MDTQSKFICSTQEFVTFTFTYPCLSLYSKNKFCLQTKLVKIMEKVKHKKEKSANIETGIPSAPTMEDFYYDPGIRDHETVRYNAD